MLKPSCSNFKVKTANFLGVQIFRSFAVFSFSAVMKHTVMFLSFRTDRSWQTEEQSDQGVHCFLFRLHRLDSLLYGRAT